MKGTPIRLADAIQIIKDSKTTRKPKPFRITFTTGDRRRDTGGERILFDLAVVVSWPRAIKVDGGNRSFRGSNEPWKIKNLTSGEIRHVYLDLIEELNGHPVL